MSKIFRVTVLAVRLNDGTAKYLHNYDFAFDYYGNFAVVGNKNKGDSLEGVINEKGEEWIPVKYKNLSLILYKYKRIEKFIVEKDIVIVSDDNGYRAIDLVTKKDTFICGKEEKLPDEYS